MNDDTFVLNICLALTTNLFSCQLQSHVLNGFSKGNVPGIFEVVYLPAGISY